jgi:hypothetical protein
MRPSCSHSLPQKLSVHTLAEHLPPLTICATSCRTLHTPPATHSHPHAPHTFGTFVPHTTRTQHNPYRPCALPQASGPKLSVMLQSCAAQLLPSGVDFAECSKATPESSTTRATMLSQTRTEAGVVRSHGNATSTVPAQSTMRTNAAQQLHQDLEVPLPFATA